MRIFSTTTRLLCRIDAHIVRYDNETGKEQIWFIDLAPNNYSYLISNREGREGKLYVALPGRDLCSHRRGLCAGPRHRAPLKVHTPEEIESALLATPNGRLALAMLDISEREPRRENDGGVLIHERNLLQAQLADLQRNFDAVEEDRDRWKDEAGRLSAKAEKAREPWAAQASSLQQEIARHAAATSELRARRWYRLGKKLKVI